MYLSRDSFIEEPLTTVLYRIFDLSYSKLKSGIDDEPLQRLLHGHEVVSRQERFYFHDGLPHLLVSVLYRLATLPGSQAPGRRESRRWSFPRHRTAGRCGGRCGKDISSWA